MNSSTNLSGLFRTTLVALVALVSLSGCGENPVSSVDFDDENATDVNSKLADAVNAASGKVLFETAESHAMSTLSLREAVLLSPYITGIKTIENSTLSELAIITPAVLKFQAAFQAEVAGMTLAEAVRVTRYMETAGKEFPYPKFEENKGIISTSAAIL